MIPSFLGDSRVHVIAGSAVVHQQARHPRWLISRSSGWLGSGCTSPLPAKRFTEQHFVEGVGYDGSSGAGFGTVESGDVNALPRPETAFRDPFFERPTLSFLCDTVTADTHEPFPVDPRTIARKTEEHLRANGRRRRRVDGTRVRIHVFDRIDIANEPYHTSVKLFSTEIETDGTTVSIPQKGGYMRTPPTELLHNLRSDVTMLLEEMGVPVRYHHHEVGASGQCEIETHLAPLVIAAGPSDADQVRDQDVARRHGKLATFMPKTIFGEAGTACTCTRG